MRQRRVRAAVGLSVSPATCGATTSNSVVCSAPNAQAREYLTFHAIAGTVLTNSCVTIVGLDVQSQQFLHSATLSRAITAGAAQTLARLPPVCTTTPGHDIPDVLVPVPAPPLCAHGGCLGGGARAALLCGCTPHLPMAGIEDGA